MGYVPSWVYRAVLAGIVTFVVWLAWASTRTPEALWAPGHLSQYHEGVTPCARCHEAFRGPIPEKCATCHSREHFQSMVQVRLGDLHAEAMKSRQPCLGCHTEHRGALAPITTRPMGNPHGDFVFRATGTSSCMQCHDFPKGLGAPPTLLPNATVRHLLEEGDGAHRPGAFSDCMMCHAGGATELD